MDHERSVQGARTVEKALEILHLFAVGQPSLSLADIARNAGLPQPTARRLVKALRAHDFVVADPAAAGRYRLGPAIVRLFGTIVRSQDLQVVALAQMEALQALTGETLAVYWHFHHERVCIMEVISDQPIRMGSGVGRSYPLHVGASGKAILSTFPGPEVDTILATFADDGRWQPKTVAEIRADLAAARAAGYARSVGETVVGSAALAAPLRGPNGVALGALNIAAPVARAPDAVLANWVEPLLAAAAAIETTTGYLPAS